MRLVEIKNSLAKLYYQPIESALVLSDFLTIDDGNQKLLAQVVSIESTTKEKTNCAILKFSLDINDDSSFSAYSGYTPTLEAEVSLTNPEVLKSIFSSSTHSITLGKLTNSSDIELNINAKITDNFLYVQSDRVEQTQNLFEKLLEFNYSNGFKSLIVDFENIYQYKNANIIELGKDFKLPVDNETLNYIYENDLTGLTLEQKTIVQDIILEIQDYISTLESGYIPFSTLLDVVNDIYESDKSTGIILLRNKLLKYKQSSIFASIENEINALKDSLNNNIITVLNVSNISSNWQKEAVIFALNNLDINYFLFLDANDEATDKETINKIYKYKNIKPVVSSKYDCVSASLLKSIAKNLILFKPEEQQRAFATYNSFLMKLAQKEFIVSGEATFYTPLIVKEIPEKIELKISPPILQESIIAETSQDAMTDTEAQEQREEKELLSSDESLHEFDDIPLLEEAEEETNELKNIFEESLEKEIAKDVDQIFYADTSKAQSVSVETDEDILSQVELEPRKDDVDNDEELLITDETLSEDDLDFLDNLSNIENSSQVFEEKTITTPSADESALPEQEEDSSIDELHSLDDIEPLNEIGSLEEIEEPQFFEEENVQSEILDNLTENDSLQGIPIYKTELDEKIQSEDNVKIAEGNIVYHEKYGRGVVEELFNYGKRTLCAIQFDNVGRRLLDPNLAELKQM